MYNVIVGVPIANAITNITSTTTATNTTIITIQILYCYYYYYFQEMDATRWQLPLKPRPGVGSLPPLSSGEGRLASSVPLNSRQGGTRDTGCR